MVEPDSPETLATKLRKQRTVPDWVSATVLLVLIPFGGCFGMSFARQAWDEVYFPHAVRDGQYGMAVMFDLAPWATALGIVTALMFLYHRTNPGLVAWLGAGLGSVVVVIRALEFGFARSPLERSFALFPVPWALALLAWSAVARMRIFRARSG